MEQTKQVLDVCAAVAFQGGRLLLATRRPGGALAGQWEFPGGKVKTGEALSDCIGRELTEELGVSVKTAVEMLSLEYVYPEKTVRLHFMLCELAAGAEPRGLEGQDCAWYDSAALAELAFAPADRLFVETVAGRTPLTAAVTVMDARAMRLVGAWLRGERQGDVHPLPVRPDWLRVSFTGGKERIAMRQLLSRAKLHTVCESAKCPNMCECWRKKTATFMVLGNVCTRNCHFCSVGHGRPQPVDPEEPKHVADSVCTLGLKHAVITCVTRDDLPDGGAAHIAAVVRAIREASPQTTVEVLVSDCQGDTAALDVILASGIAVFGHNLETVESLTPRLRSVATYRRSLQVLAYAAAHRPEGCMVKSGLMVGVGETDDEIRQALKDLRAANVDIVTLGQYLQPTPAQWDVDRMVTPDEFKAWERYAEDELGFRRAVCGPLVRSSYHAEEALRG